MNEFIEQFLLECRELVEQATADLLVLEEMPADADRLDSAFRAFHTLKGAAGIVDFDDMARALHVVEDALAIARAGRSRITTTVVGNCLSALDQVLDWLEVIQESGVAPIGAGPAADAVIARFASSLRKAEDMPVVDDWRPDVSKRPTGARSAFRYTPPENSFFEGRDPLALIGEAPGLLTLNVTPANVWPSLDEFDPFTCSLSITGSSAATPDELAAAWGAQPGLEIISISAESQLNDTGRALLEAQIALIEHAEPSGFSGRLASAARTATSVLRHAGMHQDAEAVERALAQVGANGDPVAVTSTLTRILGGEAEPLAAVAKSGVATGVDARSLRVDVERIDALVRLTGELQVAKNGFAHLAAIAETGADAAFVVQRLKEQHALLARLVSELQRSVVAIRVLPLRHVFHRFPRLVREIGQGAGKAIRLVVEGEETEADKTVVESLFEPLLHVLRNAVDHGVESADDRRRQGKPETATLRLTAARRGDVVEVTLADDGRGIDIERVRAVAVVQGLVDEAAAATLSQEEVIRLIFAPGFSTAQTVSDLSGRGVGMDAVRVAIERLGGRVNIDSRSGEGTTVRLALPFTVMMTSVMTVTAGGQSFGVPLESVLETVRVPRTAIMPIGAANAFVLRDRTIPIFDLSAALEGATTTSRETDAIVVVVSTAGQRTGLEVDRVGERMDVMLAPMEGLLSGAFAAAGTTLLGDGRVLIVLDIEELLR